MRVVLFSKAFWKDGYYASDFPCPLISSYLCLPSLKFCFLPDGEADDIKEEFADDYLAKLLKKHVKQKR